MFNEAILRTDERLSKVAWPALRRIDAPMVGTGDCLLICAGFEKRAVGTLDRICKAGRDGFSLGLVSYLPPQPENRIQQLREISQSADLQVTEFVYDREHPAGMGEKLKDFTQGFDRVFVDISGMSRLLIVQTLVALLSLEKHSVAVIYGEAEEYPPSKRRFEEDHSENNTKPTSGYLSSGVLEIATTPELSSVSMLGEALRLIAFPSFVPSQLTNLLQELQPAYTEFIHGVPPAQQNKWRTEAVRKLNRSTLDELRGKKEHDACTLDYRATLNKLLQIYAERSMFDRLVVAPTGSKMQAVAVGLFRAALHDVQIVYPTPQDFTTPKEHTLGLRQLYQLDIPAEAFSDAIGNSKDDFDESLEIHP